MTTLLGLDLERICQSISQDSPCGEDLRYGSTYDLIPELARCDTVGLSMGVWDREVKKSDWVGVVSVCQDVLTARSKDLQVAAWLCEALIHLHGINGAALGWRVVADLASLFWEAIHPKLEDDVELRIKPILWLIQCTDRWLTGYCQAPEKGGGESVAIPLANADEGKQMLLLREHISRLQELLDQRLGDASPSLYSLCERIDYRLKRLAPVVADVALSLDAETLVAAQASSFDAADIASREQAYGAIRKVAEYLRKEEPHSPVPMILEAIAGWRDYQFNDLLARMPQERASLYELLKFFQ